MNKLLNVQLAFQAYILGESSDLPAMITETIDLNKQQRIGLYADGYVARLVEALSANYPQLKQFVGDKLFDSIAREFIKQHPSNVYSIRRFGDELASLLIADPRYAKRPILAELARFEWAAGDTFDAKDALVLDAESLRNIPPQEWGELKFYFHPSVRLDYFSYNITQIWDALIDNKTKRAVRVKPVQAVLFWRHKLDMLYRQLPYIEAYVLANALKGETFAALCESLCQLLPEDEAGVQAAKMLMEWLSAGIISAVKLNSA